MRAQRLEFLQGTLDLMVLKTLETMGPLHGYGIARRIEQVSGELLSVNQGTLYPALLRLQQRGWISSVQRASENNRKARYYSLTRAGRKQLTDEERNWEQIVAIISRFRQPEEEGAK
jgi:PadR family transcriptional regulator, regulatory protein PadR